MSSKPVDPAKRDQLAAEYALGLLEGDDRARAQSLMRSDEEFRAAVARWSGRLAPLLEEVEPTAPPEAVWSAILAGLGPVAANSNSIERLNRKLGLWRGTAAVAMALAATLAIVLAVQPSRYPSPPPPVEHAQPAAPLVAMVGSEDRTRLVASWDPGARRLVLAVAGDMPADPAHAHELWVIPADGKPRSLGTMPDRKQMHMNLAQTLAELMREGATIAVSVEPPGGSPTGAPTGPVIASGTLQTA